MCPLASANTDSVCARTSRFRLASRTDHGSTSNVRVAAHARSSSSARSETTMSAPCSRRALAWSDLFTPTTKPKPPARPASTPASASSNTAAVGRPYAERLRAGEERVRRRLAAQMLSLCHDAVDHLLEEIVDACRQEDVTAVLARGDDRSTEPGIASRAHVAHRALDTSRRRRRRMSESTSSFFRSPSPHDRLGVGWIARVTLREIDPARRRGTSARRRSAACRRRTRRSPTGSKGSNAIPVASARLRRNASNISFQAAACRRRRLREHAVEVEETRANPVRKPQRAVHAV